MKLVISTISAVLSIFIIFTNPTLASTIHVPTDQPTIQGGIDAAVDGDLILVSPGTYIENINFLGKMITGQGEEGAEATIIDGGGIPSSRALVTFESGEDESTVLAGLTIQNGWNFFSFDNIYCLNSSPTIDNCIVSGSDDIGICCDYSNPIIINSTISNNTMEGIFCMFSSPTITNCTMSSNNIGIECFNYSYPTITSNTVTGNGSCGIYSCNGSDPIITGNTIIDNVGEGIYCISPATISDNTITNNAGEGIYGSEVTINSNTIIGNGSWGISCSSSTVIGNTIAGNSGGGLSCNSSSSTVSDNIIIDNEYRGVACSHFSGTINDNIITGNLGEGIYFWGASAPPTTINNTITENAGDGIYFHNSAPVIVDNTINSNSGNGISCSSSSANIITNNIIAENGGYGIDISWCSPAITNNTVMKNLGGGLAILGSSWPIVTNTIFVGASGDSLITVEPDCFVTIRHSLLLPFIIEGLWEGENNLEDFDPLLVDPLAGDYHLMSSSLCINAGDNEAPEMPTTDFEGDDRILDGVVDIGVDEFAGCDRDGDGYDPPYCGGLDCNDSDPEIFPGAPELCDGEDNDCDGVIPDDEADEDEDDWLVCEGDCDDTDPLTYPGAVEICGDGIDQDCDGIDPECPLIFTLELDGTYGAGTMNLIYTIGTPVPSTWINLLIFTSPTFQVIPFGFLTLGVVDPPLMIPLTFPLPSLGFIGIWSGLLTEEGAQAVELAWVDTGM